MPEAWSKDEAKRYFEWLRGVMSDRTSLLLEYFGENLSSPPEVLLIDLGEKVVQAFSSTPFVEHKMNVELTNAGFALAADMGLLVVRLLLSNPEVKAKWVLVKANHHVHYNLPVLKGDSQLMLNPVTGSIAEVAYALKNKIELNAKHWLNSYLHWKNTFSRK